MQEVSPYFSYVAHGEIEKIYQLSPNESIILTDSKGRTLLHCAVLHGQEGCVKTLLSHHGFNANQADYMGRTALHLAAMKGETKCLSELLNSGSCHINARDIHGRTPLYEAALHGHSDCVTLLLNAPGINVNLTDNNQRSPLHRAAQWRHATCCRILLSVPEIIFDESPHKYPYGTPFHDLLTSKYNSSAKEECIEVFISLKKEDALKHMGFYYLFDLLSIAVKNKRQDWFNIIRPLCQLSKDDILNLAKSNLSWLMMASQTDDGIHNHPDKYGCTPLYSAVKYLREYDVYSLLKIPGIDVNKADARGIAPLHWAIVQACNSSAINIVRLLLSHHDIDVNTADEDGHTPLLLAINKGYIDAARLLLQHPDIDVNKADNNGRTPLCLACSIQHYYPFVELLLSHPSIQINKTDKDGRKPIDIAKKSPRLCNIAELLYSHGAM